MTLMFTDACLKVGSLNGCSKEKDESVPAAQLGRDALCTSAKEKRLKQALLRSFPRFGKPNREVISTRVKRGPPG